MNNLKDLLEYHSNFRNNSFELTQNAMPDPIWVASAYKDEYISLICALFAYGNAKNIVKFLKSLDMQLLDSNEDTIKKELKFHKYRFQNSQDVIQAFITLRRCKQEKSLNEIFLEGYKENQKVIEGINFIIKFIQKINPYSSDGYKFWLSSAYEKNPKSPYKRWNMYLRWMVRKDEIDFGIWNKVDKKDLLMPLDVHTHKMALKLNLMQRKTYDFKAVLELTESLKKFDKNDPVKYDFALYRMGQSKLLS